MLLHGRSSARPSRGRSRARGPGCAVLRQQADAAPRNGRPEKASGRRLGVRRPDVLPRGRRKRWEAPGVDQPTCGSAAVLTVVVARCPVTSMRDGLDGHHRRGRERVARVERRHGSHQRGEDHRGERAGRRASEASRTWRGRGFCVGMLRFIGGLLRGRFGAAAAACFASAAFTLLDATSSRFGFSVACLGMVVAGSRPLCGSPGPRSTAM